MRRTCSKNTDGVIVLEKLLFFILFLFLKNLLPNLFRFLLYLGIDKSIFDDGFNLYLFIRNLATGHPNIPPIISPIVAADNPTPTAPSIPRFSIVSPNAAE